MLNCQSVRNKVEDINSYILDEGMDVFCITESWLSGEPNDLDIANCITPVGYNFANFPRTYAKGGGLLVIYRSDVKVEFFKSYCDITLQYCLFKTKFDLEVVTFLLLYRPPQSSYVLFCEILKELLCELYLKGNTICIGDLNVHWDDVTNSATKLLKDILEEYGFYQLINEPTHNLGHTLDLLILNNREIIDDSYTYVGRAVQSDHFMINFCLNVTINNLQPYEERLVRKWNTLDDEKLIQTIQHKFYRHNFLNIYDPDELVNMYNYILEESLNALLPYCKIKVKKNRKPFYDHELIEKKRERRKLERLWRKNNSLSTKDQYVSIVREYTMMLKVKNLILLRNS